MSGGACSGNSTGFNSCAGTIDGAAVFSANSIDITLSGAGQISCFAPDFRSSTPVASYLYQSQNVSITPIGVFGYNTRLNGVAQPGYLMAYTPGGTILTGTGNTGGTLSPDVSYIHVCKFQDNRAVNWINVPLYGYSGQQLSINYATQASTTAAWTTAPHMAICDPNIGWNNPTLTGDELQSTGLLTISDTGWHSGTLTYTPTATGPLNLKIMGQGGNTSGIGTGTMTIGYNLAAPGGASGATVNYISGGTVAQTGVTTVNLYGTPSQATTGATSSSGTLVSGTQPIANQVLKSSGSFNWGGTPITPAAYGDASATNVLTTASASGSYAAPPTTNYVGNYGVGGTVAGTLTLPTSSDVWSGITYGVGGNSSTGSVGFASTTYSGSPYFFASTPTLYFLSGSTLHGQTGAWVPVPQSSYVGTYQWGVAGTLTGSYSNGTAFSVDPAKVLNNYVIPSGAGGTIPGNLVPGTAITFLASGVMPSGGTLNITGGSAGFVSGGTLNVPSAANVLSPSLVGFSGTGSYTAVPIGNYYGTYGNSTAGTISGAYFAGSTITTSTGSVLYNIPFATSSGTALGQYKPFSDSSQALTTAGTWGLSQTGTFDVTQLSNSTVGYGTYWGVGLANSGGLTLGPNKGSSTNYGADATLLSTSGYYGVIGLLVQGTGTLGGGGGGGTVVTVNGITFSASSSLALTGSLSGSSGTLASGNLTRGSQLISGVNETIGNTLYQGSLTPASTASVNRYDVILGAVVPSGSGSTIGLLQFSDSSGAAVLSLSGTDIRAGRYLKTGTQGTIQGTSPIPGPTR